MRGHCGVVGGDNRGCVRDGTSFCVRPHDSQTTVVVRDTAWKTASGPSALLRRQLPVRDIRVIDLSRHRKSDAAVP